MLEGSLLTQTQEQMLRGQKEGRDMILLMSQMTKYDAF